LPRELRDKVYDGIIGTFGQVEVESRQLRPNFSISSPITYRDKEHGTFELGQMSLGDRQTLTWWRSDYMGTAVAPELIERWYATRIFRFRERVSLSILCAMVPRLLNTSSFGEVFIPIGLMQHIEFSCCPHPDYFREWRDANTQYANSYSGNMRQLNDLGKRNVKLVITMDVEHFTTAAFREAIEEMMGAIPPIMQQFHHAGFGRIDVQIDEPRYIPTQLIRKIKSEIAEATVCLHRREHNRVITYLRNQSLQR
jgi:hypothetical protein